MYRVNRSPFPYSPFTSSFSFHFLSVFSFSLHFHSQAGRLVQLVQACLRETHVSWRPVWSIKWSSVFKCPFSLLVKVGCYDVFSRLVFKIVFKIEVISSVHHLAHLVCKFLAFFILEPTRLLRARKPGSRARMDSRTGSHSFSILCSSAKGVAQMSNYLNNLATSKLSTCAITITFT